MYYSSDRAGGLVAFYATTLVLPRVALKDQLERALAARDRALGARWLAWCRLVVQRVGGSVHALAGALHAGVPRRLAPLRMQQTRAVAGLPDVTAPAGLILVCLAADGEALPDSLPRSDGEPATESARSALWERWLVGQVPEYRLTCTAIVPSLAILWLRTDGVAAAMFRPGDDWSAIVSGLPPDARRPDCRGWRPFGALHLPGAGMLQLAMNRTAGSELRGAAMLAAPSHWEPAAEDDEAPLEGRFSRQGAALGPAEQARLMQCRIAIVGCGRTGSAAAHSLARMGCSLLIIDPDSMSPHSLDGDLPPLMEGHTKVEAAQRLLRGLMWPGASLDVRAISIDSPVAGALIAECDAVLSRVDNDAARVWANAWALATLRPLLAGATDLHTHGAEADLRLLPPGAGCLGCVGGFAEREQLLEQLGTAGPPPAPADFRRQRRGSLRSWSVLSANLGVRMLEQMIAGRLRTAVFRRLAETLSGGFESRDWTPHPARRLTCPMCRGVEGAGLDAVRLGALVRMVSDLANPSGEARHAQMEAARRTNL
jgi:hypothetical protein